MPQYFKLVSEFQTIHRRPFELADPTILNPNSATPLVEGEFLELNSAYKMARGSGDGLVPGFAYFAEQGRYEVQTISKGPFLYGNFYEADTMIMDPALEATITYAGQPLMVNDVTIGAIARRGLTALPGSPAGTEFVIGYVSRLPANNGGYLRFIRNR